MAPRLNPLPEEGYPADEWAVIERGLHPEHTGRMETIFALSNGYVGLRGTHDQGSPVRVPGSFINGFYEAWPIVYPEAAYAFATSGQTIVNVPDGTTLQLRLGEEPFRLVDAVAFERTLDLRSGVLTTVSEWEVEPSRIRLVTRRLVSLERRHVAAIDVEVSTEGPPIDLALVSMLVNHQDEGSHQRLDQIDPRQGRLMMERVLVPGDHHADRTRAVMDFRTRLSGLSLGCGMDHVIEASGEAETAMIVEDDVVTVTIGFGVAEDAPFRLTKLLAYHTSPDLEELTPTVLETLAEAADSGFDELAAGQRRHLDQTWETADIRIDGPPRLQQAIRWNLFQLIQATACVEEAGVPAKGLTSQGYDGHYFWDMEMFFMPFLTYTRPEQAVELLRFRRATLPAARRRAGEMSQVGALFPWRTINGEEASAYYPAGTAQYHINAAVAYAVKRYVEATGDDQFLIDAGAEVVVATARLWYDLGFFGEDGRFHLHGVTGPDEYTALVNDNTYTNLMAQLHLHYAASVVDWLADHHPERHVELVAATGLEPGEVAEWRKAAAAMTVLYDEARGIHPQDSEFLDLERWDFANTSEEEYPLLLHHHPLVLYRHQVLKQSDVVLAMVTRGDVFAPEQKARNFAYYAPLTTHDSSLSLPIQSIVAAEVGEIDEALRSFEVTAFADLGDAYGNCIDGVHLASAGALWMNLVQGFGGMRDYDGRLSFDPHLPEEWGSLEFTLTVRGSRLDVALTHEAISLLLGGSEERMVTVEGSEVRLSPGEPVVVSV